MSSFASSPKDPPDALAPCRLVGLESRAMKTSLLLTPLLIFFGLTICAAQETQRRQVTIEVTQGEPIKGLFVRADEKTVTIQSGVAETTVKLEDVRSIVFDSATPLPLQTPQPSADKQSGADAVHALRKLATAADVGVTYADYRRILIEVKTEVDAKVDKMEDGNLRRAIVNSMEDYARAGQVWDFFIRNRGGIPTKSDLGRFLIANYGVPLKVSIFVSIDRGTALSYVWARARRYYNEAVALAGQ